TFLPRAANDRETFHGKVDSGWHRPVVVPVANHHIFINQVDGTVGVVHARFPHADAGGFAIDEAIAPYPELAIVLNQVVGNLIHLIGKQLGFIMPRAAHATVVADVEDFIHAGMVGVCFEDFADFIYEIENNAVHIGVHRAITLAMQTVGVGPLVFIGHLHMGCFVKFWIDLK